MRGPRRKRYLLLSSEHPMDEVAMQRLSKLISKRYPEMAKKAVWFERGVILRTDNIALAEVEAAFEHVPGAAVRPALVSGSIAKLKRAIAR